MGESAVMLNGESDPRQNGGGGDQEDREGADRRAATEAQGLRRKLAQAEQDLAGERARAQRLERRQRIDDLLRSEGAVDVETARLVTEQALGETEGQDVAEAVALVKARKAFLFQAKVTPAGGSPATGVRGAFCGGAMAPAARSATGRVEGVMSARKQMMAAAEAARQSGRRDDFMRYMTMRRGTAGAG